MRLGWKLPLERLSSTSMGMFIQCPEQFRQKYLLDTEEKNFGARFIGSVDHRMAAKMAEAKMRNVEFDADAAYRYVWEDVLEKDGEPDWREDDPVKMFKTGVKMSQLYWDEVVSKETYIPVAVETRIEFSVPGVPSRISGYIDTVMADHIQERKTDSKKRTKPKPKWRFQGLIYQYESGMPVHWDIVTRQVTPQLFLGAEHETLRMEPRPRKAIEAMIRDTARYMNDCYSRFGRDNPWPTTGIFGDWLCDYCPIGPRYGGTCPIWTSE